MKRLMVSLICLNIFMACFPQDYFYYYKGDKIFLTINTRFMFIASSDKETLSQAISYNNLKASSIKEGALPSKIIHSLDLHDNLYWTIIEAETTSKMDYFNLMNDIKNIDGIFNVSPFLKSEQSERIGLTNFFYVKLKELADTVILKEYASLNEAVVTIQDEFMPLWFVLSSTPKSDKTSIELANKFFESSLFQYSEPDFMIEDYLNCASDTYFSDQWGLNNTGQNGGTSGIDINACEAWSISIGSGVNIAIVDQGIDLNHPDLSANIYSSSYDTETGTSPSVVRGDHGTAVAGISGAVGNTLGIRGVAPNCKLMSISNTLEGSLISRQRRGYGINWAVQNGADVINNSWGSSVQVQIIDDAISNALTNGRSGLGCVVIFSAGNDNGSVIYPANSNPDIIAVGAMSQCGQRKSPTSCDTEDLWGSNYGTALDIVAPGVLIPTTDRQGDAGYNNQIAIHTLAGGSLLSSDYSDGNYTRWFNGTSAAAPHVAGVAALILSVNPNLTQDQVRNIIESTAQKVRTDLYTYSNTTGRPNGTWNSQMGYGLVNAYAAVLASFRITGPTTLCSSGGSYSISNVPSGATITWSSGPDIQRQSDQGANPCTFRSISDGDSYVQATITYNGQTITLPSYNVYSGLPPAPPDRYAANVDGDDGYYTKILNSGTAYFTMTNTSSFGKWWDTQWATSTTHGGNDYYLDIDADVLGTNYVLPYWTNACGISAPGPSVILEVILGKSANQEEISFGLSPNPVEQYVDIKLNLPEEKKAVGIYWAEFVNPYSVVAKKVELDGLENRVSVADLPKGYYVVKLCIGKNIYTNKLVVE